MNFLPTNILQVFLPLITLSKVEYQKYISGKIEKQLVSMEIQFQDVKYLGLFANRRLLYV